MLPWLKSGWKIHREVHCASKCYRLAQLKGQVEGAVPSLVLSRYGGTFKRWALVGGPPVTGDVLLKGIVEPRSLLFLFLHPSYKAISFAPLPTTTMMCHHVCEGRESLVMEWNLQNCEPKSALSSYKVNNLRYFCYSDRKLTNTTPLIILISKWKLF